MKPIFTQLLPALFVVYALGAAAQVQAEEGGVQKIALQPPKETIQTINHKPASQQAVSQSQQPVAAKTAEPVQVRYDKTNDQLSVTAAAASLKAVLGKIAMQSGIEVLFDDAAEATLTFDMKSTPLENGLKALLKGRNYALRYSKDKNEKLLLTGVTVLPMGEQDSSRAKRLMPIEHEAYDRASDQSSKSVSVQSTQQVDVATERWQARLSELPVKQREALEKKTKKRLEQDAQRQQRRAEKQQQDKQKEVARKEKMEKAHQARLQLLDPAQRAEFEQNSAAAQQAMKEKLLDNTTH